MVLLKKQQGLAIYNGVSNAGYSQQHKHMQFIPTTDFEFNVIDELIVRQKNPFSSTSIMTLPFLHLITPLTGQEKLEEIEILYQQMLDKLNLYREKGQDVSHNTLRTNKWLLIVPHSMALFSNIHINAFGFAGLFNPEGRKELPLPFSKRQKNHGVYDLSRPYEYITFNSQMSDDLKIQNPQATQVHSLSSKKKASVQPCEVMLHYLRKVQISPPSPSVPLVLLTLFLEKGTYSQFP